MESDWSLIGSVLATDRCAQVCCGAAVRDLSSMSGGRYSTACESEVCTDNLVCTSLVDRLYLCEVTLYSELVLAS